MDLITRLALKNRLLHVLLVSIALTSAAISALFAYQQQHAYHHEFDNNLHNTAKLVATNIGGALIYGVNWVSEGVLRQALQEDPALEMAVLYSKNGEVLVRYVAPNVSFQHTPPFKPEGSWDRSGYHELYYPVRIGSTEEAAGVLYLRASLAVIGTQMRNFYLVQALSLGLILLLTYGFGRRLQQVIAAAYQAQQRELEAKVVERTQQLQLAHDRLQNEVDERKFVQEALLHEKQEHLELIDKLEQAQNQLLQSEKMASIGQLAAGVAHEINNPVGFICSNINTLSGYIDSLLQVLATYAHADEVIEAHPELIAAIRASKEQADFDYLLTDVTDLLNESLEGIERVRKIVQDLKDFSRSDSKEYQWYDLHHGIDSTLNMANNEIKYRASVKKEYGDIPQVYCCISQINQVVLNLLVNAAQAMGDMGTITVRTGVERQRVWIDVEDTGSGIAPEHLKRIFEPFFTTKPVGKGTGLGLSLSYGIIRDHGGEIEVSSHVGDGTCFRIWLPVIGPASQADNALIEPAVTA